MSLSENRHTSLECSICCQTKPNFGFSTWKCSGHPEHICEDCVNNCITCPFCRAEPRIEQLLPSNIVIYEYIFEAGFPIIDNIRTDLYILNRSNDIHNINVDRTRQ